MQEIQIGKNEAGQRLDKLLGKYLNTAPKSFLYKMLRKKNIKLNKKKAEGNELLKEGDVVSLFLSEETISSFQKKKEIKAPSLDNNKKLSIIYEDENVLILNKEAGILSQKAQKDDISMNEYVVSYMKDKRKGKDDLFTPSICNRLDRNTSGILLAGASLKGSQTLSHLLRERQIDKYYVTVVKGQVNDLLSVKGFLHKDEKTNKVQLMDKPFLNASPIETEIIPLQVQGDYSLLMVKLITGKTHQIRAHLAYTGHPIIGDSKYGDTGVNRKFRDQYKLKHQLLHAYKVIFPKMEDNLSNLSEKTFTAPLPEQFGRIIKDLFHMEAL